MKLFLQIFQILGSLGLFLYGMKVMSSGIQRAAGERLHSILNHMTSNRFLGVLTGLFITALVQSSSATTVMVVSFVNATLLSLGQAIGVIMGANIGTTVTAWIVTLVGKFKIVMLALPLIAIGMPMLLIKKVQKPEIGEIMIGFGILFIALEFLKDSVPGRDEVAAFLQGNPSFQHILQGESLGHFFLFVAIGTLITFIVQSSSATMAVTITLAGNGVFGFYTAAAIILGENIGTTITAFLASISANRNAKRAALAHSLFNIFGVFWMIFMFRPFLNLVNTIIPGDVFTTVNDTTMKAHLSLFHTLFNITNTVLLVGFIPQFAKIVNHILKEKPSEVPGRYKLKYISIGLQDTSEMNLLNAKTEIQSMMSKVHEMFSNFTYVFSNPDKKLGDEMEKAKQMEDYIDQMQEELSKYLVECELDDLNKISTQNVNTMIRIVHELESIGDDCFKLLLLTERKYRKKINFDGTAVHELGKYLETVNEFLLFVKKRLNSQLIESDYEKCRQYEDIINENRNIFKESSQQRLQKGGDVQAELLLLDIVSQIEHIGDNSINIAQALRVLK
ncbi:MAG: Na/Pi cotransporter family protein [Spirochaetales bacterium]|nr:Na/Pi cotransporter family protein [Spirochaetales bacterium]